MYFKIPLHLTHVIDNLTSYFGIKNESLTLIVTVLCFICYAFKRLFFFIYIILIYFHI